MKGKNNMKQNRSFSIMSFLKSETVTELCGAVKDTVISTLADTTSQINGYLEKQRDLSASKRTGKNGTVAVKSHEEWKSEAIYRCLQNKQ